MKKTLSILLAIGSLLYSAESQVDLRIDTNPMNLQGRSAFNLTTTTSLPDDAENHALIFTPEMSFYTNGGIDFSITTGHRHKWDSWILGHTIFFDRSNVSGIALDQMGTGFDLQTPRFDFRMNYYHPITQLDESPIQLAKWMDAEIFFKTPWFGVGTGPLYNIDQNSFSLHSRIVVPVKDITLNLGALCGEGEMGISQAIFSISFHLFKPKKPNALTSPPCHVQKSHLYYNSGYAYEKASPRERIAGKAKLDYNPNFVEYIEQSEEEITLLDKKKEEKGD